MPLAIENADLSARQESRASRRAGFDMDQGQFARISHPTFVHEKSRHVRVEHDTVEGKAGSDKPCATDSCCCGPFLSYFPSRARSSGVRFSSFSRCCWKLDKPCAQGEIGSCGG